MSNKGENIIKKKLQDYEVPFEEKFWNNFQEREQQQIENAKRTNGKHAKYLGLLLLLFTLGGYFFLIQDEVGTKFVKANNNTVVANNNGNKKGADNNQVATINTINDRDNESESSDNTEGSTETNSNNNQNSNNNTNSDHSNTSVSAQIQTNNTRSQHDQNESNYNSNTSTQSTTQTFASVDNDASQFNDDRFNNVDRSNIDRASQVSPSSNGNTDLNGQVQTTSREEFNNSSTDIFSNDEYVANDELILAYIEDNNAGSQGQDLSDNYAHTSVSDYNAGIIDDGNVHKDALENFLPVEEAEVRTSWDIVKLDPMLTAISNEGPSDVFSEAAKREWQSNNKDRWEVGVTAGVGVNFPVNYADVQSQYNIMGRRPNWVVGAYATYYHSKRLSFEAGVQYKSIDDFFAASKYIENTQEVPITDEATVVKRLRSLDFPMGINVKLNEWLRFNTGMTLSYVKPVAAESFNYLEQAGPLNHYTSFEGYGIRNFDARVYGGLTFNIAPFVAFRFNVSQGLLDRTNNDYYEDGYDAHTDYSFSTVFRLHLKNIK